MLICSEVLSINAIMHRIVFRILHGSTSGKLELESYRLFDRSLFWIQLVTICVQLQTNYPPY